MIIVITHIHIYTFHSIYHVYILCIYSLYAKDSTKDTSYTLLPSLRPTTNTYDDGHYTDEDPKDSLNDDYEATLLHSTKAEASTTSDYPIITPLRPSLSSTPNISESLLVKDIHSTTLPQHPSTTSSTTHTSYSIRHILHLLTIISIPAFSVFFAMLTTLCLFPSITEHLTSIYRCIHTSTRWENDLFIPIQFLLFNLFDFIGRIIAGWVPLSVYYQYIVLYISLSRILFLPLFLLCNVEGSQWPVVFDSDVYPIVFMILFACSNGLVVSHSMMAGPALLSHPHSSSSYTPSHTSSDTTYTSKNQHPMTSSTILNSGHTDLNTSSSSTSSHHSSADVATVGYLMISSLTAGVLVGSLLSFLTFYVSQGHT